MIMSNKDIEEYHNIGLDTAQRSLINLKTALCLGLN